MPHPHKDIFENRREFQLERMILFSDAVFAIAITLLILDIRLPDQAINTEPAVVNMLMGKIPQLIGFAFSFAVIGQFWVNHHRLFSYISDYDTGLLWLNLHMLFWIVLSPFSTSFNFRYGSVDLTWSWYSVNMGMIGLAMYLIWRYISNPRRNLSYLLSEPRRLKYGRVRSLAVTLIFFMGFVLCLFHNKMLSVLSRFIFFLIFPTMWFISRRYHRKNVKQQPVISGPLAE